MTTFYCVACLTVQDHSDYLSESTPEQLLGTACEECNKDLRRQIENAKAEVRRGVL